MFGILNINKPTGWTSRDVVNRVQRLARPDKAGHTGTLDPLATGALIVAIGPATRLIQYSHRLPKSYRAIFLLGRQSASDDVETDQELLPDAPVPNRSQLEAVLPEFLGEIEQVPPAYAAVKVKGQRAYKLARRGERVELPPRPITIHELSVITYDFPELVLDVRCSSGTYVRSLGRDIAVQLGTGAVMSALQRTAIGSLRVDKAVDVSELEENLADRLLSPLPLVETLPQIRLSAEEVQRLHSGQNLEVQPSRLDNLPPDSEVVGIGPVGEIASIVKHAQAGFLKPVSNFPQSS